MLQQSHAVWCLLIISMGAFLQVKFGFVEIAPLLAEQCETRSCFKQSNSFVAFTRCLLHVSDDLIVTHPEQGPDS